MIEDALFRSWTDTVRVLAIGTLAYAALVALLRMSGNRTLSKMNAFDLVVTVAFGSTLATIVLNKSVSLVEGVVAVALFVALQCVVTWTSVRMPWVKRLVTGEPRLLLYAGEMQVAALRRARVTHDEVRAAVRSAGIAAMDDVHAVVMETDGSFSVIEQASAPMRPSLKGVRGYDSRDPV